MKHIMFAISCAKLAFFHRLGGRELAINASAETPSEYPALTFQLPPGLGSTAVAARKAALMAAIGTPELIAEKIAIDAELQQAWHEENHEGRNGEAYQLVQKLAEASRTTPAEQVAAAIRAAQEIQRSSMPKNPAAKAP